MTARLSRRNMIVGTSLAAASGWFSGTTAAQGSCSPNEKLNIALVGAGGRAHSNLLGVADENIVALCDVDQQRAAGIFNKYPQVPKFQDFRLMLESMESQIDAVLISAPNHIHAPASAMAMNLGKHCYCEKPLSHSVFEARRLAAIAAEQKVATQMGNQMHASDNYRRVVELIQAGTIGAVEEVHIRLDGGQTAADRPRNTPPVPSGLNWDLWLGPAPERPYHDCYVPHDWHYWWDFGGGPLANFGCHYLDLACWALDLPAPTTISADGPTVHAESTPLPLTIHYDFPARGEQSPVKLTWDHGRKRPPFWEEHHIPDWAWGVFVGRDGMLLANYDQHALWPEEEFADYQRPEPSIPASIGHHQEWLRACKTGSPTSCNFEYAGSLTETVLLGNVAYRSGQKIVWDAANLKIPNAPDAEQFLQRDYRPGWIL